MKTMTANPAPMPLENALAELEGHAKTGCATPDTSQIKSTPQGVQLLPTDAIKTRVEVCQPRSLVGQIGEEYVVMGQLKDALIRNGIERIDRVIVWWSGTDFFCVDGHHRLEAIRQHNGEKTQAAKTVTEKRKARTEALMVPVSILGGTLSEALGWTTRENGKAKLTLTHKDKSDWA